MLDHTVKKFDAELEDIRSRVLAISWGVTLIILFLGVILFHRVEKSFMDTV